RGKPLDDFHGRVRVRRMPDDGEGRVIGQASRNALAIERVIVRDHDPDLLHHVPLVSRSITTSAPGPSVRLRTLNVPPRLSTRSRSPESPMPEKSPPPSGRPDGATETPGPRSRTESLRMPFLNDSATSCAAPPA